MKIDNERLPEPKPEELHYTKKGDYHNRMFKETASEKYGITNIDFANWVNKTFDEYYLHNKHITYREYKKLI
jgi:hypothetical protein